MILENLSNIFGLPMFLVFIEYIGFTVWDGTGNLQGGLFCIMVWLFFKMF